MDESRLLSGRPLLLVVFALLLSVALIALDQTIVATALPVVVSNFSALQDVTWIIGGYLLAIVAFTPMYGQALTIFPTKWVYLIAIALFELGSLFCGIAPLADFLIFGRVFAGIGAAGICVSVLTIMAESTEIRYRAIIFGAIGAVFSLSSVVGPLLGGALTTHLSWRWCFYINLPLGTLACLVIVLRLPLCKPLAGPAKMTTIKAFACMDWIGCFLCLAAMVVLLLPLSLGSSNGWNSPVVITLLCVCILLLTCLFLWERHKGDGGIFPMRVIARRSQIGACIVVFFTMFNTLMLTYYIPLLYQAVYDHSAVRSGVDMLPFFLSMVITTTGSATILSRTGHYWGILVGGPVFCCISGGLFFTVTENTSSTKLIIYQILYGIGVGTTSQNSFIVLQAHSDLETVSVSNAIATVMQILGGFIGVTIAGVVFDSQLRHNLAVYAPEVDPGPITTSVAAVYSAVSSTARPSVIQAYVKSLDCVFLAAVPAGVLAIFGAALIRNVNLGVNGVLCDQGRHSPREEGEKD
ncbi:ABC transporter [Boletus coccyginus]|nr:ABC transporter [Boletus coccyginus]